MSVVKSKRGISSMEYIDNAEKLEVFTIRQCSRFPKRYTFSLALEIISYSRDIYSELSSANEYPTSIEDYEKRLEKYNISISYLKKMVRQIRIAEELIGIKATIMEEWMTLIDKELRLLKGITCSDKSMLKMLISERNKANG